jgi:hypothetical protein
MLSFRAKSRMEPLGSRDMDGKGRKAERTGSERIKSRCETEGISAGSFDSALLRSG